MTDDKEQGHDSKRKPYERISLILNKEILPIFSNIKENCKKMGLKLENKDLFSIIKKLSFIIAIYLYFVGWVFAHFYFKHFGITLTTLDINYLYFFIYSYSVVSSNMLWSIIFILIILIFVFLKKDENNRWINFSFALFLIVLFPVLFSLAKTSGNAEALEVRKNKNVKRINFVLKDVCLAENENVRPNYKKLFLSNNKEDKMFLLKETKKSFYVIYEPKESGCKGYVFEIQKDDVYLATIKLNPIKKIRKEKR